MYVAPVIMANLPMNLCAFAVETSFWSQYIVLTERIRLEFDIARHREIQKLDTVLKRLSGIRFHWTSICQ